MSNIPSIAFTFEEGEPCVLYAGDSLTLQHHPADEITQPMVDLSVKLDAAGLFMIHVTGMIPIITHAEAAVADVLAFLHELAANEPCDADRACMHAACQLARRSSALLRTIEG